MVSGQACPECAAAPAMDRAGTVPRPDGYAIRLECPACGATDVVNPDEGPTQGFEW